MFRNQNESAANAANRGYRTTSTAYLSSSSELRGSSSNTTNTIGGADSMSGDSNVCGVGAAASYTSWFQMNRAGTSTTAGASQSTNVRTPAQRRWRLANAAAARQATTIKRRLSSAAMRLVHGIVVSATRTHSTA